MWLQLRINILAQGALAPRPPPPSTHRGQMEALLELLWREGGGHLASITDHTIIKKGHTKVLIMPATSLWGEGQPEMNHFIVSLININKDKNV